MSTPQQSAEAFLMGGGGSPTAKFPSFGTTVAGRITEPPQVQQQRDVQSGQPKHWPDGNPMMQLVVTVQTDQRDPALAEDDGRRRIFVKGQMKNAVQDAVKLAGARGLEVGGYLSVTYSHDGQKSNPAFSAPKQFRAQYTPAAAAELQAPDPAAAYGLPPTPQQTYAPAQAASAPAGLTQQQYAAAQQNPAAAAVLQQMQQGGAPAQPAGTVPPF